MDKQHILVLGATGASGLALIDSVLTAEEKPKLTLYMRPGSRGKLSKWPSIVEGTEPGIRVVEGELTDAEALTRALSQSQHTSSSSGTSSSSFPRVTTVLSFLGAYATLRSFVLRDTTTHPIADAFRSTILPTMRRQGVSRILVLSTPTAFKAGDGVAEARDMPWKWWLISWMPLLMVPQGNAEMKGIAEAVVQFAESDEVRDGDGQGRQQLEWTVFRVPFLTDNPDLSLDVVAGTFERHNKESGGFSGSTLLSRPTLVRWVLNEIVDRKWVRGAPMLANP